MEKSAGRKITGLIVMGEIGIVYLTLGHVVLCMWCEASCEKSVAWL